MRADGEIGENFRVYSISHATSYSVHCTCNVLISCVELYFHGNEVLIRYLVSLAGQPLHKRGRVWCHAYARVVPVLVQHLQLHAVRKTALVKIWQLVGQNAVLGTALTDY